MSGRSIGFSLLAVMALSPFPLSSPVLAEARADTPGVRYTITLFNPFEHLIQVQITLPPGPAQRELQLPVWNATYQIRDFAEYVQWLRARGTTGAALPARKLNKSRWQIDGLERGGEIEYQVLADQPGPFGAQLNTEHAFFNLAEILMYPVDGRDAPMSVHFADIPAGWRIACPLAMGDQAERLEKDSLRAPNYDALVDSPVELSKFQEAVFTENGGHYHVVVHAAADVYDLQRLADTLRKIVHAETTWMQDRPFQDYMFLYHFPADRGEGGMEHAYSTAIELSARSLKEDPDQLAAMTAHEFFHLWNVKRIRPQTLAPIDYTKENYTRALWFSEGVTSTVEQFALAESGVEEEKAFLRNLSEEITVLQNRPAHATQSAEESSVDAWLEKYPAYRQPVRSVSYYNKGFLLGVLLDLAMRQASNDDASLRDLFHYLNQTYAKKDRYFDDSEGIRKAAEAVSGADLTPFFKKYVAGTDEIPYDEFLSWVALRVVTREKSEPDAGFRASRNFDAAPAVVDVAPQSEAAKSGLVVGDTILALEGTPISRDLEARIAGRSLGDTIRVRVRNAAGIERDLTWKLVAKRTLEYQVVEIENPTVDQLLHRKNWLTAKPSKSSRARAEPPVPPAAPGWNSPSVLRLAGQKEVAAAPKQASRGQAQHP